MRHPETQEIGMYYREPFLFWHIYYAYTEVAWSKPGEDPDPQRPELVSAFTAKRAVKKAQKRLDKFFRDKERRERLVDWRMYDN